MPPRRRRLLGLALIITAALTTVATEVYPTTGAAIRIWKVGSPHRGDTPNTRRPAVLSRLSNLRGFGVTVQAFPAKGFAARFADAVARNAAPDILAIDNYGVIDGITTDLGRFEGIAADPAIRASLIRVTDAFDELLGPERGWTFLFSSSPHHAAVRALALSPPTCPAAASNLRRGDGLHDLVSSIAKAYLEDDAIVLQLHADPERLPASGSRFGKSTAGSVRPCGMWGNDRLAFATVRASYEADTMIGHTQMVLILRRPSLEWQLLVAARDPITNGAFVDDARNIAALLSNDDRASVLPASAMLLSPASGRLPAPPRGGRFGSFTWRSSASDNIVAELAEFAYKDDARLFLRRAWRPGSRDEISAGQLWTSRSTWTWRVWSITRAGDVVFSEPRTFLH